MSVHEVAPLLKDETGGLLLSGQRIHDIVEEEARWLSAANAIRAKAVLETATPLPPINQDIALYGGNSEEGLLFDDGIQVKKQKEHREKPSERPSPPETVQEPRQSRTEKVTIQM